MASGDPVEVTAERTEYSTTLANPDGSYTLTESTTPRRVANSDGTWSPVDPTLERRADGRLAPKGSVVDMTFSGGGGGADLLHLGKNGKAVTFGWPRSLPVPTVKGPTATYAEVFDGVDLQLTATAAGYREVLVVKTQEAAQNPQLERVRLTASGDGLALASGSGGGLRAVDDDGNAVFHGPAGQMWDSAGDGGTGPAPQMLRAASPRGEEPADDPSQPGEGDAGAVLPVKVEEGSVEVHPDLGLLRGKDTVYPVYIDPSVGLGVSERTKISSDGDKFWMFDGDKGVGKCGTADGYSCGSGYVDRMYFEFAPTKLAGKHVLDATFRAHETWSFNCDPHWLDLERTDNISEGTRWPGPKQLDQMGDRYVSAGRNTQCSPQQPDKWIEFNDNPDESDENLKSTVNAFADGKMSRLTLMLRAHDETDPRAWKRFDDNAELQVNFAYKPGTPTDVGLIPGDGTTAYCKTSAADPLIVTRKDPMVQARVQTKVEAHKADEEGSLQAEFTVERGDDSAWHHVWSGYRPDQGWDPDGTLEKMRTAERAEGGLYRYKARTQSHWTYGSASGDLFSAYSPWCYFKIDSTAPKSPQISPTPGPSGRYTECTTDACQGNGGPGLSGGFTFKPNPADTDITGYEWRLLTTTAKGTKQVTGSTAKVNVTPSLAGTQVLSVRAKDVRSRWGAYSEFSFKVSPRQGAVGRWHFDDAIPNSGSTLAKDTATEGTRHDASLRTAGAGWSWLARRGDEDYSLWLNDGESTTAREGYADTAEAAVNTRDSFTLSAWVYLTDASQNHVVLAAPGVNGSAFTLYYSAAYKKWVFNRTAKDVKGDPVYIRSVADADNPPLKVWTHLSAVFKTEDAEGATDTDPGNDTIQLFVNGRAQGQPVVLRKESAEYEPWVSSDGLQIGRSRVAGSYGEYFRGRIDELAVWQQALTSDEIAHETQTLDDGVPTSELVAHWDAASSAGTELSEFSAYAPPTMKLSASGAEFSKDDPSLVLDGNTGYAAATGPVVDESGSFTVSATVRIDSTKLADKPVGYSAQVAGQQVRGESSWALWVVKPADNTYQWKFTRSAVGSDGKVTQSAQVAAADIAETNTWATVTGIFDAQEGGELANAAEPSEGMAGEGKLHLYVGQFEQPADSASGFTAPQQGSGELAIGRGTAGGRTEHYLPGALQDLRIWTGAMSTDQVRSKVLAAEAA